MYTNKYVSDIPLKRPQETFVDDPGLLEEVNIDELVFDLENDIKNINKLHIFHSMSILASVLHDLIRLSQNKLLLKKFREQHLAEYGIELEQMQLEAEKLPLSSRNFHDDDLPLPVKIEPARKPSVGSLSDDEINLTPATESVLDISIPLDNEAAFILCELLVQTTLLDMVADPITTHSNSRLKKEVAYHMAPKVKSQAELLVRSFALAKVPPISIDEFLLRINKYSPSVSVLVYIHCAYMLFKLCVLLDVVPISTVNVYRLILALIRCLTKKLEDIYQKQLSFAMVGGVAPKDLGKFEVSFLYLANFKLVVSEYILNHFLVHDFVPLRRFCEAHKDDDEN